jgi:enoyl-CoA hydratase
MSYKNILYDLDGPVAVLTMNRPEVLNAQSQEMKEVIMDACRIAEEDREVRVIILKGAGRAFSSGHDLKGFPKYPETLGGPTPEQWYEGDREAVRNTFYNFIFVPDMALHYLTKPTIAQVQGYCVAGGWLLASMCDLIVASEDARFRDPVVLMAAGGLELLVEPWDVGVRKAKELMWTGDYMDAWEAFRLGMVNKVVPSEILDEEAMNLALRIALTPPATLQATKRSINHALDLQGWRSSHEQHFETFMTCMGSSEHQKGHEGMSRDNLKEFLRHRDRRYT